MSKFMRRLKKARNKLARSKAVTVVAKALPTLGVAMGPLGRTAGVKLGTALSGAQRAAKVSKGDFSQELSQVRQLSSVLGGRTGEMLAGAAALAEKGGKMKKSKAKPKARPVATKAQAAAAAKRAVAGAGAVIVAAKSGRKYRVERVK